MRRMISFLLLAATAASPLAAQSWNPDGRRDGRESRRDVQNDVRRGDWRDAQRDRRALDQNSRRWVEQRRDWQGDRRDWRDGRRDWRDDRGWNRDWRSDRRYDWQGYRYGNRDLYRAPRYYAPGGHSYRRWSPGYRVEPYFYGRSYWISDPSYYRLPPIGGYYRWVRYYDDVALIDIRSGLIEDIIHSFFWR